MSISRQQATKLARNLNTQFAKLVIKLCAKHCSFATKTYPKPPSKAFHTFELNMYAHRVLYFYYISNAACAEDRSMQSYFLKLCRNKPSHLVKIANTPTEYIQG